MNGIKLEQYTRNVREQHERWRRTAARRGQRGEECEVVEAGVAHSGDERVPSMMAQCLP